MVPKIYPYPPAVEILNLSPLEASLTLPIKFSISIFFFEMNKDVAPVSKMALLTLLLSRTTSV